MSKAALISEMLKFRFGSKVVCSDGEYGALAQVVFDTSTRCMTHIEVRQGRLFGKTALLPFDTISSAGSDGIMLRMACGDVEAASHTAVDGEAGSPLRLNHKSIVELAGTASRGTLALVAVYQGSGELAYLVAHHLLPGQDTLVRAEFVTALATDHVTVSVAGVAGTTPGALPPYRPDDVLQREVESILFDLTPLHIDLKGMKMRVLDGVLYLDGNISSSLRGDIVVDQVSGVTGLLEIKNNLVADDQLAADLAVALSKDARTRDLPIGVYPRLGVVRLHGTVQSVQQKAAAEEIARGFPGVKSVINELGVDHRADILPVMAPAGGDEDIVPNKYTRHTK